MSQAWQIKDLKALLKDFKVVLTTRDNNGRHWLLDGNNVYPKSDNIPIEGGDSFKLRYREAWANRLLCAVLQELSGSEMTFSDEKVYDKSGKEIKHDGIIINRKTGEGIMAEHVCSLDNPGYKSNLPGEQSIVEAINHKVKKGPDYAKGKLLVVFFDGVGVRYPNKVGKSIAGKHNFEAIYGVCLLSGENNEFMYLVSNFQDIHSPTFRIAINEDFDEWKVTKLQ